MYYTLILLSLAILSPIIFAFPKRSKIWAALAIVVSGALVSGTEAVMALLSGQASEGHHYLNLLFGEGTTGIDPLSSIFILMCSLSAIAVTIYSRGYLKSYLEKKNGSHFSLHYVALVVLYFSLLFVLRSRDAFSFMFAWEMMTISSYILILFEAEKREVRKAALNYLILMHVGFMFLLVGFVTVASAGLPATFDSLGIYFSMNNPLPLFLIFLIGFGMKAGIFPMHVWLPEAHPAAPSHISAMMSGVMIKMGVYGVMRIASYLGSGDANIGLIVFIVGAVTGLWGIIMATMQNDIKRLMAYSSMENIGIIFIAIGGAIIGKESGNNMLMLCGMSGALLHTINHSFFKTVLFFGAGNIYTQTHTRSLDDLGGLAKKMPTTAIFVLAGVGAICALPALNGFVSEFLIYYGFLDTISAGGSNVLTSVFGLITVSLIGGLVVLVFTKLYGVAFLGSPRSGVVENATEVDKVRIGATFIPLAFILAIGLFPHIFTKIIFNVTGQVMGIDNPGAYYAMINPAIFKITFTAVVLIGVITIIYWLKSRAQKKRIIEQSETWGCGFTSPSSKMQYTGESYSEGLKDIAMSMTKSSGEGSSIDKDEIFPKRHGFSVHREDKVDSLFTRWWVSFLRTVNTRVMRLRTGKVNYYVLYALMFLVLIFLLSAVGII